MYQLRKYLYFFLFTVLFIPSICFADKEKETAEHWFNLGIAYLILNDRASALEVYKVLKNIDAKVADELFRIIQRG